jgi:dCMP deaminase
MSERPSWGEMFMLHAILAGVRSSCLKRQVGAVLERNKRIIASGYNGAPPKVSTCLETKVCFYEDLAYQDSLKGIGSLESLKEERKIFCSAVHAEKNAFNQCSNHGVSAVGANLYITNFPCPGCVRDVIIPNQIEHVFVWKEYLQNKILTHDEYSLSKYWLGEAGIGITKMLLTQDRVKEIFATALMVGNRLPYQFDVPKDSLL